MVVETLSQADEYLSPEIEACLNNAESGRSASNGQPPRLPGAGTAPPGAGDSRRAMPGFPPGPQGQGQGQHRPACPGAAGSVSGHAGLPGGSAKTAAASSSGTHPPDGRLQQNHQPHHQHAPPPPLPPPPQPQATPHPTRMAPNSERSVFSNHRSTKSMGGGFEAGGGGGLVGAERRDVGGMAMRSAAGTGVADSGPPHSYNQGYLMSGPMPRLTDYDAYQRLCNQILAPEDKQKVAGKHFIKKSGWRKLAMAFDISFEIRQCEITHNDQGNVKMATFIVRGMLPNGRFADAWGGCDSVEKRFNKPNHDVPATAETRAKNRACADLLGMRENTK